jgi:hypothetical protein
MPAIEALRRLLLLACFTALTTFHPASSSAQTPTVGDNEIGGVVTGARGPEAGVWVIAETTETPTKMAKIVVTDDQGRYLIPDLPAVDYSVWVRGYGLIDSPKMRAKPGTTLDLKAVPAPNKAEAVHFIRRSTGTR